MIELLLALFLEQGLVCVDEISARQTAAAIAAGKQFELTNCGAVTGTVIEVRALPTLYVNKHGLGLRVVEGLYLGKTVFYFRLEYSI